MKIKYPKGIKVIYDDGKSIDRYTVYYSDRRNWGIHLGCGNWHPKLYPFVGMSDAPFHPQGFGQHGEGHLGKHNGKRISFNDLSKDCQKFVLQDLRRK